MFFTYGYIFYLPINIIYAVIIMVNGIKKKRTYPYYIFAAIFAFYINNAINLVYFPIITETPEVWGNLKNYTDISLDFSKMGGIYQILGNILLTIPIGILLPFVLELKKRNYRICVITTSSAVELIQLFIIYFTHSVTLFFDVKDLMLNAFGGIIGCILFEIFAKIIRVVIHSYKRNRMLEYIYKRCCI